MEMSLYRINAYNPVGELDEVRLTLPRTEYFGDLTMDKCPKDDLNNQPSYTNTHTNNSR